MSRSRKNKPIAGNTLAETEKADKRLANRKLRASVRKLIDNEEYDLLRTHSIEDVSNVWTFGKDGKTWLGDWQSDQPWRVKMK